MLPFGAAVEAYLVIYNNLPQPVSAFMQLVFFLWFLPAIIRGILEV